MRFLAIAAATTFIVAFPAMGQDTMVPRRQAYRNGEPVTKDTPPPNKKPPNVHEVRKAAGYVDKTKENPPQTLDSAFCCTMFILCGLLVAIPFVVSQIHGDQEYEEYQKNLPLIRERIRILEEKARKGDLVAFQQWKEATGRVGSNDIEYSVFVMWW